MKYNTIKMIAADKNLIYIDYNEKFDELGFTINEDFYDNIHLSQQGSVKVSNDLADYINLLEKEN